MAINTVIHTNEQSIDRVLGAGVPVLLVFWKDRAQPMQELDPVLERLAARYAGRALIAKVNADEEKALVQRYRVEQIPTLVFVKDKQPKATIVGSVPERDLDRWFRYLLEGGSRPPLPKGPSVPLHVHRTGPAQPNGSAQARPQPGWTRPGRKGQAEPPSTKPITLTDANFQNIIAQGKPVLVDFWAPWCGPCHMIAPSIEQLAKEFQGRAIIGKLNVDENPMTAQQFQVMSIPTVLIFRDGRVVDQLVGVQPLGVLRQRLMQHL